MVRPSYAYTLKPVEDTHLGLTNWLLVGGVLLIELPANWLLICMVYDEAVNRSYNQCGYIVSNAHVSYPLH